MITGLTKCSQISEANASDLPSPVKFDVTAMVQLVRTSSHEMDYLWFFFLTQKIHQTLWHLPFPSPLERRVVQFSDRLSSQREVHAAHRGIFSSQGIHQWLAVGIVIRHRRPQISGGHETHEKPTISSISNSRAESWTLSLARFEMFRDVGVLICLEQHRLLISNNRQMIKSASFCILFQHSKICEIC